MSNEITPGKPIRIYQQDGSFNDFSTEDVVAKKLNSFTGWKCGAGVENICINFDGDILSASCGVSGAKAKNGKYGNVFEEFTLESEWITCPQQFCSCGADLFIPKIADDNAKKLLFLRHDLENTGPRIDSLLKPVALERTFSTKNKQIFWELGRRCNYDCSYCHSYVHNNYEEHKSLEKLLFATEKLERFGNGEKINFAISGGEPTINPDYLAWVKILAEKGHHISTHSNGSRNPEYYVELIKYSDINISIHFEFFDQEKILQVITAIINELRLRKLSLLSVGHFELMIMSPPGNADKASNFEKELWKIGHLAEFCNVNIMPIRGHESIEKKDANTGDVLLNEYTDENLKNFGTKTMAMHILEVVTASEEDFSKYDQLDGITDSTNRRSLFNLLNEK